MFHMQHQESYLYDFFNHPCQYENETKDPWEEFNIELKSSS